MGIPRKLKPNIHLVIDLLTKGKIYSEMVETVKEKESHRPPPPAPRYKLGEPMPDRTFKVISSIVAGTMRQGVRVHCRECPTVGWKSVHGMSGCPPELVFKHFRRQGWEMSQHNSYDLCPICATKKEKTVATQQTKAEATKVDRVKADPPRQISKDEHHVAYLKLTETYIDETVGYAAPWTDQRVADDLKLPVAWITDIREKHFGNLALNEDHQKYINQALGTLDEAKKVTLEAKVYTDTAIKMGNDAQRMNAQIEKVLADVKRLSDFAEQLRRKGNL
jgi:hypothetical protein